MKSENIRKGETVFLLQITIFLKGLDESPHTLFELTKNNQSSQKHSKILISLIQPYKISSQTYFHYKLLIYQIFYLHIFELIFHKATNTSKNKNHK